MVPLRGADHGECGPHRLGHRLAASGFEPCRGTQANRHRAALPDRRRPPAQPASGVGAGCGCAQEDPGRQSGATLRLLSRVRSQLGSTNATRLRDAQWNCCRESTGDLDSRERVCVPVRFSPLWLTQRFTFAGTHTHRFHLFVRSHVFVALSCRAFFRHWNWFYRCRSHRTDGHAVHSAHIGIGHGHGPRNRLRCGDGASHLQRPRSFGTRLACAALGRGQCRRLRHRLGAHAAVVRDPDPSQLHRASAKARSTTCTWRAPISAPSRSG